MINFAIKNPIVSQTLSHNGSTESDLKNSYGPNLCNFEHCSMFNPYPGRPGYPTIGLCFIYVYNNYVNDCIIQCTCSDSCKSGNVFKIQ